MYSQQLKHYIMPCKLVLFWGLIAVVSYLLLMEQTGITPSIPYLDKLVHAILFATLTFTGYWAYTQQKTFLYLGLLLYGALTEVLQGTLTLTRYASLYDWFADVTGILLCILLIQWINSSMNKNNVS